jgi:hypothetical protein
MPDTETAESAGANDYWSQATVHSQQPGFVGTIARGVGAGLANIVRHPLTFAEGLIPGAAEAQQAYSHGLTPQQRGMAEAVNEGALGRFAAPGQLEQPEIERRAQQTAAAIGASPIRRAIAAGLSPEAAPLQTAEYALAGKALEAAEAIPGVQRLIGQGVRKSITQGAALGAGFQGANEAASVISGHPDNTAQATANVIAAAVLGGTLGGAAGMPEYFARLKARGALAHPLEEAEGTAERAEAPEEKLSRKTAKAIHDLNVLSGKEAAAAPRPPIKPQQFALNFETPAQVAS